MKSRSSLLGERVRPVTVSDRPSVGELLSRMGRTGFQARNLALCVDVWEDMLRDEVTIFFGLAGAMVPVGMRSLLVYLIENRMIDCLVSTGANLFHDIHETLGRHHYQGHPGMDDLALKENGIDRIYDVLADDGEFSLTDRYIHEFSRELDATRAYTTREFLHLLGRKLSGECREEGVLTAAYKAGVPVYCPAIGDSSIGIALTLGGRRPFLFDVIGDVEETARMVMEANKTGVVYIGGGTPKNFVQQTEVTAAVSMGGPVEGHEYAIQITMDSPHWGGLSGCTFEEAQSWGKISKRAKQVTLYCDASIALPLVVAALGERFHGKRVGPSLDHLWQKDL